jgi:two-component system, OmpR family, phosphate regulon sensor histidine kinase PhoR
VEPSELERKAEVAQLLLDAARQLGETLEPERVYDRFHELLAEPVPHDGVVVSSYDERDGLIRCDYAWVEGNRLDPAIFPPLTLNPQGGGMQSRVITSGEPLLVNDVAEQVQRSGTYYNVDREGTVRKLPESGPAGTSAAMMVPVKHEGRVVGVVQVMSDEGVYTHEQLEVMQGLVAQMASAVRTARLQNERLRLEAAEAAALAAAAEREQAAHVLEAVGDGIFLADDEGVVRLWNRAAEVVTGMPAEKVRDRPVTVVFPDWEVLARRIPVAEGGDAARAVTLPTTIDGRDLWLSFVAVRSSAGVVYAFRDLTNERRLEEAKSDFIATISHELRTPMAAVYGAAETLLRLDAELTPDRRRQLLEMIATQSARLSQITEEILLSSQLDRGELSVQRSPVDVVALARSSVDAMRPQLQGAASLDLQIGTDTAIASGDADRIQQVLINLLDNAVKYGGGGPVTVRVDGTGGRIRVAVADSGPGIASVDQRRIFEKFFRGDPNLTHAPSGTGLGLYISRELVERMGGRLDVESQAGAGATFVVTLPQAQSGPTST